MRRVTYKVAIMTETAPGMGAADARLLVERGARVALTSTQDA